MSPFKFFYFLLSVFYFLYLSLFTLTLKLTLISFIKQYYLSINSVAADKHQLFQPTVIDNYIFFPCTFLYLLVLSLYLRSTSNLLLNNSGL